MSQGSLNALEQLFKVAQGERPTLWELRQWYTEVVLAECKTIKEAALVLGVNPTTLFRSRRKRRDVR